MYKKVQNETLQPNVSKQKHSPFRGPGGIALLLGIIAFVAYANTLPNGYALDDSTSIQQNAQVKKGISAIPDILATPYHHGNFMIKDGAPQNDLYRPLSLVLFAIEYQLFPDSPLVGHLGNVLLFAGCVMLLFLFLYHLFRQQLALAFTAALLFALHPLHTEVVANIKSCDELLCFLFAMLSLNSFIKYLDYGKTGSLISGLVFYFLSLLSKETSITFVAVIPLIFFFYRNENRKRSTYISLLALLFAIIYLAVRFSVLIKYNEYNPASVAFYENALIGTPGYASRLATEIFVLGNYIKLLVIPYPLICDYAYSAIPFATFTNVWVWTSFIIYGALIYLAISRMIKKKNDPLTFGILFFLITISIFTNMVLLIGSEMSERFMFFPSVGYCLAIAFIIVQVILKGQGSGLADIKNKKLLYVLVPISLVFIGITIYRNTEWKDSYTLFEADIKKSPDNCRLYVYAATQEMDKAHAPDTDPDTRQQMFVQGVKDYRKCLAIYPDFKPAQVNIALAFIDANKLDSAASHAGKALALTPDDPNVMNILSIIYFKQDKFQESIALDRTASAADPTNAYYPGNIGICDIRLKQYDSAIYYFRRSVNIDVADYRYVKFMANTFKTLNQRDSAKKYVLIAQRSDPNFNIDKDNGFK